jgi:hypothetical protein
VVLAFTKARNQPDDLRIINPRDKNHQKAKRLPGDALGHIS